MSLAEQQKLLARLYTDADLREKFLSAPQKIGRENDLTETEIEQIAAVLPEEIKFFAESLVSKRLGEVGKLLPLTKQVLSEDFEKLFRRFAREFLPADIKKHLADALRFAAFLQKQNLEPRWLTDLVKFESARLEFNGFSKSFVFRVFRHDVREIVQEISRRKNFEKRRTFAIWLRGGGRARHFVWSSPFVAK